MRSLGRKFMVAAGAALVCLAASPALAQASYPTAATGVRAPGTVPLQCNSSGAACAPVTATNPAGPNQVVGTVASGTADDGSSPVKAGCVYLSAGATFANGQRSTCLSNFGGQMLFQIAGFPATPGDGGTLASYSASRSAPDGALPSAVLCHNWTGTALAVCRGDANGALVQYGLGQWTYASGTTGILSNTTVAVTFKAAAGAAVRNFVDSCQISTTAFTTSVPIAIRDGAGGAVIWAANVPTQGFLTPLTIVFQTPLRGTANTLLEVVTTTANTTGSAMINCQGHTGT